jgi:dTMP kinase
MASPRGLFLSLDGPDGAGKSTQCRLLAEWLRSAGHDVVTCAEPGGTGLGKVLRELLLERRHTLSAWSEALLFMASRAQLVAEVIEPALGASQLVVCDRFLLSTVVYQGHAGGLDPRDLWDVGRRTARIEPDLTLVLDLPVETSLQRRNLRADPVADRFESRPLEYQSRVRAGFLAEAAAARDRIKVIDATADVTTVQEAIRREVEALLHGWRCSGASSRA